MKKLLHTIHKEVSLLMRDKAGLAVLFIMPVALVFVITLLQDAPIRNFQRARIPIIFVDMDGDKLGNTIKNGLIQSDYFELTDSLDGQMLNYETARQAVASGKFKVGIVVPEGATARLEKKALDLYQKKISPLSPVDQKTDSGDAREVIISFDPTIQKLFKTAVLNALSASMEKIKSEILLKTFSREILNDVSAMTGGMLPVAVDDIQLSAEDTDIIALQEEYAIDKEIAPMPNSVQHNVPAWSMFAIFFVALPLSGNIIRERESGSLKRLLIMPVSSTTILLGKISVYVTVAVIQFILMMMVGMLILPALGTPALNPGNTLAGLSVLVLSSALAATAFGILVGVTAGTQEQASTFCAVSIIIAAAIGGIMVPVYLMPPVMQQFSVVSPLAWGLSGFLDIFVRGALFTDILTNVILLLLFTLAALVLAVIIFKFKAQHI